MSHVVIIGNGIAGITTARYLRKRDDAVEITVISSESKYFYSRPALMYIYMGHMKYEHTKPYEDWFWEKNRIELLHAHVERIDTNRKKLALNENREISYDKLVIATGSKTNYFNWPGQGLKGVQGLYSLQDVAGMEENTHNVRRAVVVGGGLIGVEMAEMLHSRGIQVTFLIREPYYWGNILRKEEAEMVGDHMRERHIHLELNTNLKQILADSHGRANAVVTDTGREIPCEFVGIATGVSPNIAVTQGSPIRTDRGIRVNAYLETNVPDVYACGDCAQFENGTVEQLWYTGRMQGEVLAGTILGDRTAYDRGIWFNSAKMFDLEYQTYGQVPAKPGRDEESLLWRSESGDRLVRLVYGRQSRLFQGMNSLGIRYRHKVFERWLAEKRTIDHVLAHLWEANFDPEFFTRFENEIVAVYNRRYADSPIFLKPRKKLLGIF